MINPVEIFSAGGMLTVVAFLCAVIGGGVAAFVPLLIGLRKLRWPASVSWLGLVMALVFGVIGAWIGDATASSAASAHPTMAQTLLAAGISKAMYSEVGALLLLGPAFLLASTCTALPGPILPGDGPKMDLPAIGGAVLGALLGTALAIGCVVAVFGSDLRDLGIAQFVLPFIAVVGTVNVLVASLRISGDDRNHQARMVGLRGLAMTSALVAILLAGHLFAGIGEIQTFRAVAVASPDQKEVMFRYGLEIAGWARTLSWFMLFPVLFAGVGSILPHLGRADGRTALGFGIATAQIIVMTLCLVFMRSVISGMFHHLASAVTP
jgi:hypothetical protein